MEAGSERTRSLFQGGCVDFCIRVSSLDKYYMQSFWLSYLTSSQSWSAYDVRFLFVSLSRGLPREEQFLANFHLSRGGKDLISRKLLVTAPPNPYIHSS